MYVESEDSYFYALTSDGALKWKYQTGNFKPGHSSAAIGSDGTVYVGSYDGCLYAFAPEITGVKNLALKSPRGSETWIGGIRQGIVWGFSGVANIKIEYSTDMVRIGRWLSLRSPSFRYLLLDSSNKPQLNIM